MQTHDFFTRMVALNCIGPNMVAGTGERSAEPPKKIYFCGACDASHDSYFEAEDCCKPEVYSEYACPACSNSYGELQAAEACCGRGPVSQPKQCPVCLGGAESYEDAADCCLHTHPTMTALGRQRIAEAVAAGAPWPEALAANVNH